MQIKSNIFIGIDLLRITYYSFHCESFEFINIFYISNEVGIANLLRIAAASILPCQQISQLFIAHEGKVIKNTNKLLPCNEVAFCAIIILQGRLHENSLAANCPSDVIEHLLYFLCILSDSTIITEGTEVCPGEISVAELFIYISDKFRVFDEISWLESVFICEDLDLVSGEIEVEEAESRSQSRYELIIDAETFSKPRRKSSF